MSLGMLLGKADLASWPGGYSLGWEVEQEQRFPNLTHHQNQLRSPRLPSLEVTQSDSRADREVSLSVLLRTWW